MKNQTTQANKQVATGINWFKRNQDFLFVLSILAIHFVGFIIVKPFFYLSYLNSIMHLTYIGAVISLEIGLFSGLASGNRRRSFSIACITFGLFPIILKIIFPKLSILLILLWLVRVLIMIAILFLGLEIGRFLRNKFIVNFKKLFIFGISFVFLVDAIFIGFVMNKLVNCKPLKHNDQMLCYQSKVEIFNDVNVCAEIEELIERRYCYERALFSHDVKRESTTQCDGISNENDREYCYSLIAKETLDNGICNIIKNRETKETCSRTVGYEECSKIPLEEDVMNCRRANGLPRF